MYYQGKTYDTIGQVFDEALRLAKNGTRSEIEGFFKAYANTCSNDNGVDAEEGINIAKRNLGYFSGYCDNATAKLIYETYNTCHPIWG